MITPAKDFREDKKRSAGWTDTISSIRFNDAATVAMAQMELNQTAPVTMEAAVAKAHQLQGAKMFLSELMALGESQLPPAPTMGRPRNLTRT